MESNVQGQDQAGDYKAFTHVQNLDDGLFSFSFFNNVYKPLMGGNP